MIQRTYLKDIVKRILEPRKFIQVLYGSRQVGKTTLILQALDQVNIPYVFETADDIAGLDSVWLRQLWSQARLLCQQNDGNEALLVVDEVQKIANWSEIVKREWDEDTRQHIPLKVVLLGSSSLLIQQGLTESLAGRFESIPIPHWSYSEMREAFGWNVEQYIWFGGYPGSASLIGDEPRWKRYIKTSMIDTSLSKDVMMMTRIDKPALLRRLFDIGCSYSAQIVSLTKVQGELEEKGNIGTLSNYLSLLSYAGLLCGLEKFSGDVIRSRSSKPKFQVYNNALMCALNEKTLAQAMQDGNLWGRFCESAVGTHLLNGRDGGGYELYYWNENSREVDYVMRRGKRLVAIEVKSGKKSYNQGMELFATRFSPQSLYTIGTDGIPLEQFLSMPPENLL